MKLLLATPLYPPEIGGPATYAKLLFDGLPGKGASVELVKFSDVRRLPKLVRHYVYYRNVLRAARNADVVLALDPVSVGFPAMCAAKIARKKFVVKIVGDYAWEQGVQRFGVEDELDYFVKRKKVPFAVKFFRLIQTTVANKADKIIVPSEYLKRIVEAWGINKEKIFVIYNGVNVPQGVQSKIKKEGELLIVSAGRRVPWKGFEGIERVAKNHSHWKVFIASGLSREETLSWIKSADVFVLNSLYEGLSHLLIEAMTLGTPVIATRAGGNHELVSGGETGLLIAPGSDLELENALIEVENNRDEAIRRARLAEEKMKMFSVTYMLEHTANFLKSL